MDRTGWGVTAKKLPTPALRLIRTSEFEELCPLIENGKDKDTVSHFLCLDDILLEDGFSYKKMPLDSLNCWAVMPSEEEILKSKTSENNGSVCLVRPSGGKEGSSGCTGNGEGYSAGGGFLYEPHDLVCFGKKDFGLVLGFEKEKDDTYKILKEYSGQSAVVTVPSNEIMHVLSDVKLTVIDQRQKNICVNDTVKVLEGPLKGRRGMVKQVPPRLPSFSAGGSVMDDFMGGKHGTEPLVNSKPEKAHNPPFLPNEEVVVHEEIEADELYDVQEACKGLYDTFSSRVTPVLKNVTHHLLAPWTRSTEIAGCTSAHANSGNYKGDLGQVYREGKGSAGYIGKGGGSLKGNWKRGPSGGKKCCSGCGGNLGEPDPKQARYGTSTAVVIGDNVGYAVADGRVLEGEEKLICLGVEPKLLPISDYILAIVAGNCGLLGSMFRRVAAVLERDVKDIVEVHGASTNFTLEWKGNPDNRDKPFSCTITLV